MKKIFSCKYSSEVAQLLYDLQCSLIISSHSANSILLQYCASSKDLIQRPRPFPKPMGIAIRDDETAISTVGEITFFKKIPSDNLGKKVIDNKFDNIFVPRQTFHCGELKIHDIEYGLDGLWLVNTEFSCLGLLSEKYSFEPKWCPPFISKPMPGDACHLNGLVMKNGFPKYVTALGTSNTARSWKERMENGGCLIDAESNEIILDLLSVPHSPRLFKDQLYLLQSGTGEVLKVDPQKTSYEVIAQFPGFVRGLDQIGQYLFVAYSKIRKSSGFEKLKIAKKKTFCGIAVIDEQSGKIIGTIEFENSIEEIFDIKILPKTIKTEILSPYGKSFRSFIHTPDDVYFIS